MLYRSNGARLASASPVGWAVYWKNGVAMELASAYLISQTNGVTVVGNDVYIAGAAAGPDMQLHATYWKKGVPVTLDSTYSVATGIAVYQNDAYVVGNRGADFALLWKNGKETILGTGRANAILVRK